MQIEQPLEQRTPVPPRQHTGVRIGARLEQLGIMPLHQNLPLNLPVGLPVGRRHGIHRLIIAAVLIERLTGQQVGEALKQRPGRRPLVRT